MQVVRSAISTHPFRFGRGPARSSAGAPAISSPLAEDLKLFATTFVAGFLFVSILLA
jgi:hypothetical protein